MGDNGSAWFLFQPRPDGWQLGVVYLTRLRQSCDFALLDQKIQEHLRQRAVPVSLVVWHLECTELSTAVSTRHQKGKADIHKISWNWDDEQVGTVLDAALSAKVRKPWPPVKLFITNCYFLILSLVFAWQGYLSTLGTNASEVYGINLYNWHSNELSLMLGGIFLHSGMVHFLLNAISLFFLGALIERFLSALQMILVLLISGYCGALCSLSFYAKPLNSIGASGVVFGLVGCSLSFLMSNLSVYGPFHEYQGKRLLQSLWTVLAVNGFLPLLIPQIDIWSHVGGLISGFVLGFLFLGRAGKFRKGMVFVFLSIGLIVLHEEVNRNAQKVFHQVQIRQKEQKVLLDIINTSIAPILIRLEAELMSDTPNLKPSEFPYHEEWIPEDKEDRQAFLSFLDKLKEVWGLRELPLENRKEKASLKLKELQNLEAALIGRFGLRRVVQ
ncbi:MAG: rhomboid family intramembrane serine protease [Candidatus Cloacimonetes bacterium]|nr:rhomboid family intramembrane serine protease [Candidatus Cloacimonadota bacterium]